MWPPGLPCTTTCQNTSCPHNKRTYASIKMTNCFKHIHHSGVGSVKVSLNAKRSVSDMPWKRLVPPFPERIATVPYTCTCNYMYLNIHHYHIWRTCVYAEHTPHYYITTSDICRTYTSLINQALVDPLWNNIGQNTAKTCCGKMSIPCTCPFLMSCCIVHGTR